MINLETLELKKFEEYTLDELQNLITQTAHNRQHGRKGEATTNEEDEKRRLYNNLASRVSRAKRKSIVDHKNNTYKSIVTGIDTIEDKYGISAKDERRYRTCFSAGYIGLPVELDYVRRMTGLDDAQIFVLQQRTGLLPYPAIKRVPKTC